MKTGIAAAILSALCMATLGIFSRKIAFNAEVIIFFRMGLGALFLLLFLLFSGKISELYTRPTRSLLSSGFFLASFALCYFYGLTMTTLANAVTLLYLAPLTAALFAHFFLKERLTLAAVFLILLALFGFAMMLEFRFDFASEGIKKMGLLYSFLSMIFYAAFIINNRLLDGIAVYNKTFYQLFFASLFLLPFAVYKMDGLVEQSASIWLWLTAVGIIPGFLGILLAVLALDRLEAVTFGTLSYLEPIFVVLFGWVLFAEKLSLLQGGGCLLILVSGIGTGIIAAQKSERC